MRSLDFPPQELQLSPSGRQPWVCLRANCPPLVSCISCLAGSSAHCICSCSSAQASRVPAQSCSPLWVKEKRGEKQGHHLPTALLWAHQKKNSLSCKHTTPCTWLCILRFSWSLLVDTFTQHKNYKTNHGAPRGEEGDVCTEKPKGDRKGRGGWLAGPRGWYQSPVTLAKPGDGNFNMRPQHQLSFHDHPSLPQDSMAKRWFFVMQSLL